MKRTKIKQHVWVIEVKGSREWYPHPWPIDNEQTVFHSKTFANDAIQRRLQKTNRSVKFRVMEYRRVK